LSAASGNSFACYGCIDWANNERTLAYYGWACANGMFPGSGTVIEDLCTCPADSPEDEFTDPATDQVCWYDPAVPESTEFLGAIILRVTGSRSSTVSRDVQDGFLEGSVLQRLKRKGRSFGFEILLVATSCEGMHYGEEWLRGVLEDDMCAAQDTCQSCSGRELTLRVHCPTGDTTDDGLHTWHSVGVVDGLTPVEREARQRASCCNLQKFTFSMQSESPYSFSTVAQDGCEMEVDPDGFVRCYDWMNDCEDCQEDCCDECGFDAYCTCFTPPVVEPEEITDNCFCVPLARAIDSCCIEPQGYETTFKIDVFSGTSWSDNNYKTYGMRNYTLQIFDNPIGYDCITDEETYNLWCNRAAPCAELRIAYVPYNSTLTIDGRTGKVTLTCKNKCVPYDQVVTNISGALFPLVTRCQPIMIVSMWDYYNTQLMPNEEGVERSKTVVNTYLRFKN